MADSTDTLFGPISKEYCFYFYILSVFGLVFMVLLTLFTLFIGIRKKEGFPFYLKSFSIVVMYGLLYLQNRLLFNMCSNSL